VLIISVPKRPKVQIPTSDYCIVCLATCVLIYQSRSTKLPATGHKFTFGFLLVAFVGQRENDLVG